MTERVDLRRIARVLHERIVRRHRAIVIQAQHLAGLTARILRAAADAAGRDIQLAVAAEHHSRRTAEAALPDEDVLHVNERVAVPASARDREHALLRWLPASPASTSGSGRRRRRRRTHRLRITQIDELIRRELRVQRDLHQPAETAGDDLRHAGDRCGIEHAVAQPAQLTRALRDQHVACPERSRGAARQPHHAPRRRHPARHHDDADVLALGGRKIERLVRQRHGGNPARRDRRAATSARDGLLSGKTGAKRQDERNRQNTSHGTPMNGSPNNTPRSAVSRAAIAGSARHASWVTIGT